MEIGGDVLACLSTVIYMIFDAEQIRVNGSFGIAYGRIVVQRSDAEIRSDIHIVRYVEPDVEHIIVLVASGLPLVTLVQRTGNGYIAAFVYLFG